MTRPGYRLEITDRALIAMPRWEVVRWVVPGPFGYQPGRRMRCDICIGAGCEPMVWRELPVAGEPLLVVECDRDAHAPGGEGGE